MEVRPRDPVRDRRVWLAAFAVAFGLMAAWTWATPLFASPDAPSQVVKAAAVVRGEWVGRLVGGPASPDTLVRVPAALARATSVPVCFAFHPQASAGCAPVLADASGSAIATTSVGRYPPLYYLVAGLGSLLASGAVSVYLMGLASAVLPAAFLASAVVTLSSSSRGRLLGAGFAVAVTPMVFFLGGVVNPSGLEIASAIAFWTSGLVLVTEPELPRGRLLARAGMAAAVLTQLRGLGPFLLAVDFVVLLAAADGPTLRAVVRDRRTWAWAAGVFACGVFAVVWILSQGSLDIGKIAPIPGNPGTLRILELAYGKTYLEVRQMFGIFGWLDTPAPTLALACFYVAILAVAGGAALALRVRAGHARRRALLALAVALGWAVIAGALTASQAHRIGLVGQGRYYLPIAAGAPLLAACALADARPAWDSWARRWAIGAPIAVSVLWWVAQVAAFAQTLHRYAVGYSAPIGLLDRGWHPPGIPDLALAGLFAVLAALAVLGLRAVTPRGAEAGVVSGQPEVGGTPAPTGGDGAGVHFPL